MNNESKEIKPIYFLSTGRVGTKFIYKLLSEFHPEVKITHQDSWSRFFNIISNIPYFQKRPEFQSRLFRLIKKESQSVSTLDPLLSMLISTLIRSNKINGNIKLVHLLRDPRDFVTSFMNLKNKNIKKFILHHLIPFWQPSPLISSTIPVYKRIFLSKFEHYCWIWQYKNILFNELNIEGIQYALIRMEDITHPQNGERNLKIMLDFLEINHDGKNYKNCLNKKIDSTNRNSFPKWYNWENRYAKILSKYCSDLMQKYDYGNELEWKNKLNA